MSGGSWEYAYQKMLRLAEDLDGGTEDPPEGWWMSDDDDPPGQKYPLRRALGKALEQLAMGPLKAIEWSDSGDYAEDGWIEPVREFLERRPIDLPEVREFYDQFMADATSASSVEAPRP